MKLAQKITIVLLLAVGFVFTKAHAQEGNYYTVRDFEIWTGAKLKYKFNEKWSVSFEHQYRFEDNASVIDQNFIEMDLKRNIGKHFSLAMAGRYIRNNDTNGNIQGNENHFRWNADLGYKTDIKRFTISSRLRYQSRKEFAREEVFDATKVIRLKLGTEYNIKKWKLDPEFSTEVFKLLSYQEGEGIDKIRFTLGTSYKMKKFGKITGFYRIEKDFIGAYPPTTNIVGLKYQYTFKKKNNEK